MRKRTLFGCIFQKLLTYSSQFEKAARGISTYRTTEPQFTRFFPSKTSLNDEKRKLRLNMRMGRALEVHLLPYIISLTPLVIRV